MKRYFCMIMALWLVLSMAGCGQRAQAAAETSAALTTTVPAQEDPILEKLLQDLIGLMDMQEKRYHQENDTLKLIMEAGENAAWESYVRAQAACGFTCDVMAYLAENKIQPSMTEADYQALQERGMDVGDVQAEFRIYNESTLPLLANDCYIWREGFLMDLMYACYDVSTAELVAKEAQARYQGNLESLKYWYLVCNYVMLELPEDYGQKLLEMARERTPITMSSYQQPFESTNDVLNEMNKVLNAIEELSLAYQALVTESELLLQDAKLTGRSVEGLPRVILFPESVSLNGWEVSHYWKNGEQIETLSYPMVMDTLPNCMFMTHEDVTLDAYQRYVLELNDAGLPPDELTETAALYQLEDGTQILIYLEGSELSISVTGGQVCFAPLWYMDAMGYLAGN